ncbi:MAG: lolD [Verrucomicrobia bacterium]|jgi:ABC-type lipoprotein export system ATPase subunit|nr:lolD [Verrucomicrobiota bacterium]
MSNATSQQLLSATDVRKNYQIGKRQIEVLKGVSLTVQRGEFVALQGASGAGKSTLLHLLGGLDQADTGNIHFENFELTKMSGGSLSYLRGKRMGFIFQSYHLLPELDALENVCVPGRLMRMSADEAEKRGRAMLGRVGLGHRLDHRPTELSGGEQQRVAIARALMNQPTLLLADEPTGNLDSKTGGEIMDLLRELQKEQGTTMIIATHDDKVAERAERVVRLVDGQIVVQ